MSAIRFLADHDLNDHIVSGIHRREPGIELLRARDLELQARSDSELLDYANRERLLLVSHDVNTMTAAASERLAKSQGVAGLLMVPQSTPVNEVIESLMLIWSATELDDWRDKIVFLPL